MCHVAAWDRLESSCSSGTRRALKFFLLVKICIILNHLNFTKAPLGRVGSTKEISSKSGSLFMNLFF